MTMDVRLHDVKPLAAVLDAAETAGLLAAIAERPGTADDLAARCSLDARACARVLEVLRAFGIVTEDGNRYVAGPELERPSPRPEALVKLESALWRHAPDFLRTGVPLVSMDAAPAEREGHYRDVVAELATLFGAAADHLAERCGLTAHSILEIGC